MEHQALYCEGLGTFNYLSAQPRQVRSESQRAWLTILGLSNCGLPKRLPKQVQFDLTTYEVAQLFGGGN